VPFTGDRERFEKGDRYHRSSHDWGGAGELPDRQQKVLTRIVMRFIARSIECVKEDHDSGIGGG